MEKSILQRRPMVGIAYLVLFTATIYVNKYVLSVLRFTYPTIFQGWQTFVGAIVLQLLMSLGKLDFKLTTMTREDVALWLPGMFFFMCSIYSGSRALANLTIPVFISFQNIISVIDVLQDVIFRTQKIRVESYIYCMTVLVSAVGLGMTDPQYDPEGYFWMWINIISSGACSTYTQFMRERLKLSAVGKLYCNYIYSMILFAPSSYFLGEALEAAKFPYLYFAKFYVGCVLSGVFGVLLNLLTIMLESSAVSTQPVSVSEWCSALKLVVSVLSFFIFHYTTGYHLFWFIISSTTPLHMLMKIQPSATTSSEDLQP